MSGSGEKQDSEQSVDNSAKLDSTIITVSSIITQPVAHQSTKANSGETINLVAEQVNDEQLRRSHSPTELTLKARENKVQELNRSITAVIKGRINANKAIENELEKTCPIDILTGYKTELTNCIIPIDDMYKEIRRLTREPETELCTIIDRLERDRDALLELVEIEINKINFTQSKPHDSFLRDSVLSIHSDDTRSHCSGLSRRSIRSNSSVLSLRRREAAAESEVLRAELKAQREHNKLQEELDKLKQVHDEELKKKTRQINEQMLQARIELEDKRTEVYRKAEEDNPSILMMTAAPERSQYVTNQPRDLPSTAASADMELLAKSLINSISLTRLPAPEPPMFCGDPLLYVDWLSAFTTLIEQRATNDADRMHYLKRYLSGPARDVVSGYFMSKSVNAYERAKKALDERYGNKFLIAEAFRTKISSWPKIQSRDSIGLRKFADFLQQCLAAMDTVAELSILDDCRENIVMLQKLPEWLVNRWTRVVRTTKRTEGKHPSFAEFCCFISEEAEIVCDPVIMSMRGPQTQVEKQQNKQTDTRRTEKRTTLGTELENESAQKTTPCMFCEKTSHDAAECFSLGKKTGREQEEFVKTKGLCFGCLQKGHMTKNCEVRKTCSTCAKKHPSSLHTLSILRVSTKEVSTNSNDNNAPYIAAPKEVSANCGEANTSRTGLSTMIVPVWLSSKDAPSEEQLVYALLDSQSDTTFVLDQTAETLYAAYDNVALRLSTMTSKNQRINCKKYKDLQVRGYNSDVTVPLPAAFTRSYIPVSRDHIPTSETVQRWDHLKHLAHVMPGPLNITISLLIGYNCPLALAPRESVTGSPGQPFAVRTDLGWSIVGQSGATQEDGDAIGITHCVVIRPVKPHQISLRSTVAFECKEMIQEISPYQVLTLLATDFQSEKTIDQNLSQDDIAFLKILNEGIRQEPDGHYSMPLPFRSRPSLPNNKGMALRRLELLERKLRKNPHYMIKYNNYMRDLIDKGYAEEAPLQADKVWYIPHFGVHHPQKPSKLRVVFDASAKHQGQTLNNHLLQGPDLVNNLVGVLLRFRKERVGIMCDIEKMFHQFRVHEEDRDYFRFLWREDNDEVKEYRMTVHLFGATSSPGCATFGLRHIAQQQCDPTSPQSVKASEFIQNNFYVDDGLASITSATEAIQLIDQARKICSSGGVRLHKFICNSRDVMDSIPVSEHAEQVQNLDLSHEKLPIERALGVEWCVESDCFQFRILIKENPFTRRGILSTVASIFDPLGLLAPFILTGKQILQDICREGTQWDDPLSESLTARWKQWRDDLLQLAELKIDRCYVPENFGPIQKLELHHFSDASTTGYGQCSYLRAINTQNEIHCTLVAGKGRVTPLKLITVPRTELQAAVLSAKMSNLLQNELRFDQIENHFWTDSKIVLGYIANEAKRFHVYVANRVEKIRELTNPNAWEYVKSEENPADHASRGLRASNLLRSNWFTGPKFLWDTSYQISATNEYNLEPNDPEVRAVSNKIVTIQEKPLTSYLNRFSKWEKAVGAFAVLLRRARQVKMGPAVYEATEKKLFQLAQEEAFADELEILRKNGTIAKSSPLCKLKVQIDSVGLLRVGGRIPEASTFSYEVRHPLILPKKGKVTELIIAHYHHLTAHQGQGMTVGKIRSAGIWIVGCSSAVSKHIKSCYACHRLRGKPQEQEMACLPKERFAQAPPFTYVGADCFGPIEVKDGRREVKRYGLIVTCMASRAVHVEMLDDMSTDAFLNALRNIIAIRGPIKYLKTDRGTNFVGAQSEWNQNLEKMMESPLKRYLTENRIEFVTNVPAASHMGGVWERLIRTIRSILNGLLDQHRARLDSATLRTLLYEVMAIINSRPLSVEHINDATLPPLTPNHILTMKSSVILPPPGEFEPSDVYSKKRWRRVQEIANQFWLRWRREYVSDIQPRQKWNGIKRNVQVGDVVLLKEEEKVRSNWRLGKIVEAKVSNDGLVRSVRLQMGNSNLDKKGQSHSPACYLERPIHKVVVVVPIN